MKIKRILATRGRQVLPKFKKDSIELAMEYLEKLSDKQVELLFEAYLNEQKNHREAQALLGAEEHEKINLNNVIKTSKHD